MRSEIGNPRMRQVKAPQRLSAAGSPSTCGPAADLPSEGKRPPVRQKRLYTPEVADLILDRLANGEGLRGVCRTPGLPTEGAVRAWVIDNHDGFAPRFQRATMIGIAGLADELLEIADAAKDVDSASAARVQIEARKWLLSKLLPKVFGDKLEVQHTASESLAALLSEARQRRALLDAPAPAVTLDGTAIPDAVEA